MSPSRNAASLSSASARRPFNLIHIRNMATVTEAGASVFPVIPTFYNHPQTVEDIARNYVHRVLQHMGLPQPNAFEWGTK